MTELALVLVLLSAVAHAGWNFIAKRASARPVFNWLFDVLSVVVCLPVAVVQVAIAPPHLGPLEATFIVGSAVLHLAYFLLLYFFLFTVTRAVLLSWYALRHLSTARQEWRIHKRHALGIAVLSPLSYILVLYALSVSPVSYVAPVREIGILLGAVMGSRWLSEGAAQRRVTAAAAMVAGVVALALG